MRPLWLLLALASLAPGCDEDRRGKPSGAPPPGAETKAPAQPPSPSAPAEAPAARAEPAEIVCQQVLVSYKGATKAKRGLVRSKEVAKARAEVVASLAHDDPDAFDELVKKYSDDPSAEQLGSTGLVKRQDLVKPFADAAFALEVGQVSPVVESLFGFHVIKRTQ